MENKSGYPLLGTVPDVSTFGWIRNDVEQIVHILRELFYVCLSYNRSPGDLILNY